METPTFMSATYTARTMADAVAAAAMPEWRPNLPRRVPMTTNTLTVTTEPEEESTMKKRLVRVLMLDPHEYVPAEMSVIYDSKEIPTDKTDQELYFDIPVAALLKEHNEKRTKIINKDVRDRTEYLEPARISNLKLLVLALAEF